MSDRRHLLLALAAVVLATGAQAQELADPTRPSHLPAESQTAPAARAPVWRVQSILVSAGRRLAVVNGQVVGVNDRIGDARVVEILPYEVRLEYQGETRRLSLVPTRVKRPAN